MSLVFATQNDVSNALVRSLNVEEALYVDVLLEQALDLISDEMVLPDIDASDDPLVEKKVRRVRTVQAEMVARKLRNVDGVYNEADGKYSYRALLGVASGKLELTDDDRALLGIPVDDTGMWVWNPTFGRHATVTGSDGEVL